MGKELVHRSYRVHLCVVVALEDFADGVPGCVGLEVEGGRYAEFGALHPLASDVATDRLAEVVTKPREIVHEALHFVFVARCWLLAEHLDFLFQFNDTARGKVKAIGEGGIL